MTEAIQFTSVVLTDEGEDDEQKIALIILDALQELEQGKFIRINKSTETVYVACRSKYAERST